jgi:hypothetical protein
MCRTHLTIRILHYQTSGFFDHVKTALVGQRFGEPEGLIEAVTENLNEIQRSELELAFSLWLEPFRWVLADTETTVTTQSIL